MLFVFNSPSHTSRGLACANALKRSKNGKQVLLQSVAEQHVFHTTVLHSRKGAQFNYGFVRIK